MAQLRCALAKLRPFSPNRLPGGRVGDGPAPSARFRAGGGGLPRKISACLRVGDARRPCTTLSFSLDIRSRGFTQPHQIADSRRGQAMARRLRLDSGPVGSSKQRTTRAVKQKKTGRDGPASPTGRYVPLPGYNLRVQTERRVMKTPPLRDSNHVGRKWFPVFRPSGDSHRIRSPVSGRSRGRARSSAGGGRYGSPACASSPRRYSPRPRAAAHRAPLRHRSTGRGT